MEKLHLILLTSADGIDVTPIGPFRTEEEADTYSKEVLEPVFVPSGSTIRICDICSPLEFINTSRAV